MNRRKFIGLIGGGVVLAAGAAGGYAVTRRPERALEPWKQAGTLYSEPRKKALSYAILAPNPHNRQPWLVDLSQPEQVVLYADMNRLLPHTDPFNRQITIGLGCFLELMAMAAAEDGVAVSFDIFPEGEDAARLDGRPVAIATFAKARGVAPDPLFAHVMERRSLKEPYDLTRPVSNGLLKTVSQSVRHGSSVGTTNEPAEVQALRELSNKALRIEVETPRTYKESVDLFRIGHEEIEANPDGIDFSGPLFETLHLTGMFSREAALDTSSSTYAQGMDAVLENTDTAMAHIWLVTANNARRNQIDAGRDWLRINLATTSLGISTQPLSQALQEYTEMAALYDKIHAMFAPGGGTVQMFARLGYAAPVAASPRWPLDARLI
ncbi:MAG: twin-arginine translocation pathway signal protein [Hyphomicrobiales bacterium]